MTERPTLFHAERQKLRFMIIVFLLMKSVQGVKINWFLLSWHPRTKGIRQESKAMQAYKIHLVMPGVLEGPLAIRSQKLLRLRGDGWIKSSSLMGEPFWAVSLLWASDSSNVEGGDPCERTAKTILLRTWEAVLWKFTYIPWGRGVVKCVNDTCSFEFPWISALGARSHSWSLKGEPSP